jgi:hypothetical protein
VNAVLARGEVVQAALIGADDAPDTATLFTLDVGSRRYWRGLYANVELGGTRSACRGTSTNAARRVPARWFPLVSARGGIGGKLGPVDLG